MSSLSARPPSRQVRLSLPKWGDERLAERVKAGDQSAFATIYERYHQPLYRYCRSIVQDDTDAQDALQSAFERAYSALSRGQRNAPLRPWLFRIAHNEAITVIRRRPVGEPLEHDEPAGFAASAEHEAAVRARLAMLVADLAELPERARSALVMRELGDLSHEDIAVALEISPAAAKQAIFEARKGLQEAEEGRAMPCDDVRRKLSDGDRRALRGRRVRAHLRDCSGCAAFAAAIPARRGDLHALAPALPPAAAAAILTRAIGGVAGHGAGAGIGVGTAGGVGKGVATAALSSKLAVGAAVLATAAAGAGGVAAVSHLLHHGKPSAPSAPSAHVRAVRARAGRSSAATGRAPAGAAAASSSPAARRAAATRGHHPNTHARATGKARRRARRVLAGPVFVPAVLPGRAHHHRAQARARAVPSPRSARPHHRSATGERHRSARVPDGRTGGRAEGGARGENTRRGSSRSHVRARH